MTGAVRVNEFFTETSWLPRLDHFWNGQPLVDDTFTWYEHTSLGYAQQGSASKPTRPDRRGKVDAAAVGSARANCKVRAKPAGRNSICRFKLGPVKIVPYVLAEVAHWDEDLEHQDLNRAYGVFGVRASMPMWAVDPTICSELFNVQWRGS